MQSKKTDDEWEEELLMIKHQHGACDDDCKWCEKDNWREESRKLGLDDGSLEKDAK